MEGENEGEWWEACRRGRPIPSLRLHSQSFPPHTLAEGRQTILSGKVKTQTPDSGDPGTAKVELSTKNGG